MDKARWQETLVYALNRPVAYAILEAAARLGAVVRVTVRVARRRPVVLLLLRLLQRLHPVEGL